jgi:hypothetical protein
MDASQRWETEALRTGSQFRKTPPQPSVKQQSAETEPHDQDANWVTLKEAEAATGVPVNTLRKWSRKSAIPSYLESDGELSLRMVDLDAVITHAHDLGRETAPAEDQEDKDESDEGVVTEVPEGTLIVPLDAWNKMLNQLGNLHEAGQQLAEARERAAKAETEATFLRERLAEVRAQNTEVRAQNTEHRTQSEEPDVPERLDEAIAGDPSDSPPAVRDGRGAPAGDDAQPTTSYWRYLTFGWRDRKRRGSKEN